MPKLFVFAIGGTGERVLRSFTMVLASGAPTFDNYEIYPIIIDYDEKNADKIRTVELLQNYADVHRAAFARHSSANDAKGRSNQFFAAELRNLPGLENYVFPFHPASENEKFSEYIGYGNLAGETLRTGELLHSLYDESGEADTELNLDMTVGFKGNPNIGSVVFHTIGSTDEFRAFSARFQPQSQDKVVIIGSLFGGTGASGIPEIVKAIDALKRQAAIATIFVLPYFAPADKAGGAIKASRFNSKTKAALSFYKDSQLMQKIDKAYYVGDPYPTVIPYSEGGDDQRNNANLVELIAAMMIEHYVAGRDKTNKEFKFSLNANIVIRPDQKSGQRLFIENFDVISLNMVLNHLVELSIALKFFHDDIYSKSVSSRDFFKTLELEKALGVTDDQNDSEKLSKLCKGLEAFYKKYNDWLKELDFEGTEEYPANSHRMAISDMSKTYNDIILRPADTKTDSEGTSTFSKIGNFLGGKKNKLDTEKLCTRMDFHFGSQNSEGHFDSTTPDKLKTGHEPEWAFVDILHKTAADGFKELNGKDK